MEMNIDEALARLDAAEIKYDIVELPNKKGKLIRCKKGGIVACYDTGKCVIQGSPKQKPELEAALGVTFDAPPPKPEDAKKERTVFVVYGHDQVARDDLELMLRRWNLQPLILDKLPSEGATIIEKLLKYTEKGVHFGVVLATPDDEAYPRDKPTEKKFRARQNVVLELGILLDRLGRNKVAILLKDAHNMERPSDLHGLIYIPFREKPSEAQNLIAKEMAAANIEINVKDL